MEDQRGEQRKQWWQRHHESHEVKRSMKRRKGQHDYYSRCIYMVTLVVEGRKPVLGELCGPDEQHPKPWLRLNELGRQVLQRWHSISSHYPEVRTMDIQLMPDHMHGILFVTSQVPYHLGTVINGFKKGCNDASRNILGSTLWEHGYHDRILTNEGQLVAMVRYIHDNPRRLWTKRNHPEFFTVKQEVDVAGKTVAMAGNRFLLDYPFKVAVQCSRRINTKDAIAKEVERYLNMAREGAVLVSPCISPCEKQVMRAAFEAGMNEIVLLENGFSPMWKPGGAQFDACAQGQLLFIAPWPYHSERRKITQAQCWQLNALARDIAAFTGGTSKVIQQKQDYLKQ